MHVIPQAAYMRETRQLTQKKKTQSCSEPIHAIVDAGRALSWCSRYHVWKVPNELSCPNVQKSARNAPQTVSHARAPPSGYEGGASSQKSEPDSDIETETETEGGSETAVTEVASSWSPLGRSRSADSLDVGGQPHFSMSAIVASPKA